MPRKRYPRKAKEAAAAKQVAKKNRPSTRGSATSKHETAQDVKRAWSKQQQLKRNNKWAPSNMYKPPKWASNPDHVLDDEKGWEEFSGPAKPAAKGSRAKKSSPVAQNIGNLVFQTMAGMEEKGAEGEKKSGSEEVPCFSSLADVRYPRYVKPDDSLLEAAHKAIQTILPEGDCESFECCKLARRYYEFFKPKEVKVILLAESHVFTPEERATIGPKIGTELLPESLYDGPRDFISLVYCLGYGEQELLEPKDDKKTPNQGTPQFWSLFAACARGVAVHKKASKKAKKGSKIIPSSFCPDLLKCGRLKAQDRAKAKLNLLLSLKEQGVWLLDTSILGWYITQSTEFTLSQNTNNVHKKPKARPPQNLKTPTLLLSWECYIKHVIQEAANDGHLRLVVPIGKEVARALTRERLVEAATAQSLADAKSVRVVPPFPAPNAQVEGGYGPFYKRLAQVVHEVAPPISNVDDGDSNKEEATEGKPSSNKSKQTSKPSRKRKAKAVPGKGKKTSPKRQKKGNQQRGAEE